MRTLTKWNELPAYEQANLLQSCGLHKEALMLLQMEDKYIQQRDAHPQTHKRPKEYRVALCEFEAKWLHQQGRFEEAVALMSPDRANTPCTLPPRGCLTLPKFDDK